MNSKAKDLIIFVLGLVCFSTTVLVFQNLLLSVGIAVFQLLGATHRAVFYGMLDVVTATAILLSLFLTQIVFVVGSIIKKFIMRKTNARDEAD